MVMIAEGHPARGVAALPPRPGWRPRWL